MRKDSERAAAETGHTGFSTARTKASLACHIKDFVAQHYDGRDLKIGEVNLKFCNDFAGYLKSPECGLSANSRCTYFKHFSAAMNAAVRSELISRNPVRQMDSSHRPKEMEIERAYLTADEMRVLSSTPLEDWPDIKSAFLFSCMCGLRWSDIKSLEWNMLKESNGSYHIEKRMVKTKELLYLPLCRDAVSLLPTRTGSQPCRRIFNLPSHGCANKVIKRWVSEAGISKKITFHNARHTFGTMLITLGADLYTTSKLMGHSSIKVTQIYAKIVDKKKEAAVNLFNGLLGRCNV